MNEQQGSRHEGVTESERLYNFLFRVVKEEWAWLIAISSRVLESYEDAEDVAISGWYKAYENMHTFSYSGKAFDKNDEETEKKMMAKWLKVIVRNTALDMKKRQGRREGNDTEDVYEVLEHMPPAYAQSPSAEQLVINRELADVLSQAISTLPKKQQQVIILHDWEGRGLKATAEALRMPENTVKTNIRRARILLRAAIEKQGYSLSELNE